MTPEEFFNEVQKIVEDLGNDEEICHCQTDDLMEELLIELGYGKGIELIQETTRWYA